MNFKYILTLLSISLISFSINAQLTVDAFVKEGIKLHDNGQYEEAIATYKKALVIEPNSALVNYEIALSYYVMGDYKNAIKFSDKVLKEKSQHSVSAFITKGNALDMMGKTKKSIKVFKEAIEDTDGHYLLNYNLAINYFKKNDLVNAEINAIDAIENNPNHASSHLMLAHINNMQSRKVPAILASHFFLLLEPNSGRSQEGYNVLTENFDWNVEKDPEKENTINIVLDPSSIGGSEFSAVEMMIPLLAAAQLAEDSLGVSKEDLYISFTNSVFKMLGESRDDTKEGIWWDFYIDFYYDLVQSDHFETYMYYIMQSFWEGSEGWIDENEEKLEAFRNYLGGGETKN